MEAINAARGSPRFLQINLTAAVLVGYSELSRKKKRPGLTARIACGGQPPTGGIFSSVPLASPMSGGGGEASACRYPYAPVCQPCHSLLSPFDSGACSSPPAYGAIMPNTTTPDTTAAPSTVALHRPFSWLHSSLDDNANAQFIARTLDVCNGVALCLDLAQMSDVDRATCVQPVLSVCDASYLMLLATASVKMLADSAAGEIESMNSRAQKGGAA
jgi:hypothetical protein